MEQITSFLTLKYLVHPSCIHSICECVYNILLFLIIVQIEGATPIRGGAVLTGDSLQTRDGAGAPGKDEREGKDAEREEGVRENGSGREEARPKMEVHV